MPIGLSPAPATRGVLPHFQVKLGLDRCGGVAGDSETGPERIEREEPMVPQDAEKQMRDAINVADHAATNFYGYARLSLKQLRRMCADDNRDTVASLLSEQSKAAA